MICCPLKEDMRFDLILQVLFLILIHTVQAFPHGNKLYTHNDVCFVLSNRSTFCSFAGFHLFKCLKNACKIINLAGIYMFVFVNFVHLFNCSFLFVFSFSFSFFLISVFLFSPHHPATIFSLSINPIMLGGFDQIFCFGICFMCLT